MRFAVDIDAGLDRFVDGINHRFLPITGALDPKPIARERFACDADCLGLDTLALE
jgi:hypothetical protein